MTATNAYGLYGVGYGVAATPDMLGGITDIRSATDPTFRAEVTGGEVYPRSIAFTEQSPMGGFGTYHLAAALAAIGATGYKIDSGGTPETSLLLYLQKFAMGSTREAGANHKRFQCHQGIVVPRQVNWRFGSDAVVNYEFLTWYDGTNNPIVKTGAVTLPTASADDERFSIGPVAIGGATLAGMRSVTCDFGVTVQTIGADSDVWPDNGWIATIAPRWMLTSVDPDVMYDVVQTTKVKLEGSAAAHADTEIYFKKWADPGVSFVADNVAEHVKFTMAGIAAISQPFAVQGQEPGETGIVVQGHYDGSNAPVLVTTGVIIT